ncbi:hypothetical protein HNY73_011986 [Argiope bruennichi]|uniref:Uncharacterized protein n=1 Tax=Argiope bruennichi TaxID=94029 RepID=A0A8T0ETI0_ARGBR|nr:hypothetical protein HNY73_011986 [Argiope bruennichi]
MSSTMLEQNANHILIITKIAEHFGVLWCVKGGRRVLNLTSQPLKKGIRLRLSTYRASNLEETHFCTK